MQRIAPAHVSQEALKKFNKLSNCLQSHILLFLEELYLKNPFYQGRLGNNHFLVQTNRLEKQYEIFLKEIEKDNISLKFLTALSKNPLIIQLQDRLLWNRNMMSLIVLSKDIITKLSQESLTHDDLKSIKRILTSKKKRFSLECQNKQNSIHILFSKVITCFNDVARSKKFQLISPDEKPFPQKQSFVFFQSQVTLAMADELLSQYKKKIEENQFEEATRQFMLLKSYLEKSKNHRGLSEKIMNEYITRIEVVDHLIEQCDQFSKQKCCVIS